MPPENNEGLLAAVTAGIAEASAPPAPAATPAPPSEPVGDTDDAPPAAQGADDGAQGTGDSGGTPGEAGVQDADGGNEPAAGDGQGGTGVHPAGDQPKLDAEGKPIPAEPAAVAKAPDPLNDPLPNALKKETKERFNTIIGMVKETSAKLETVTAERNDILGAILDTQATPEQYTQALGYLKLVNSPNRADREQALVIMQQEVAALARMLGKPVPGVNMLEGHQDLIDEVSTGRLSPERAQEIAAARHSQRFEEGSAAAKQDRDRQIRANQEAIQKGVADLNVLGTQLRAANPAKYDAIRPALVKSLKPVFAKIPPTEWAATFRRAYDALSAPATTPPPTPPRGGNPPGGGGGNTPLRAGNPAGGTIAKPTNMLEAINAGIAAAGR